MTRTLDEQREEYSKRRFLAMPLAGTIMWAITGASSFFLPDNLVVWVLFISTGCIVYLGMFISRFTGENFLDKNKPKNVFDSLFMHTVVQALLVYAIAIPFFMIDYTSLPLTVGILTGLMWLPLSWVIQHRIGIFHTAVRTALIVVLWYIFPEQRFLTIPIAIIIVYAITIYTLEARWRRLHTL